MTGFRKRDHFGELLSGVMDKKKFIDFLFSLVRCLGGLSSTLLQN